MTDTSEPAFPTPSSQPFPQYYGMSLRDYFAGQALVGLFSYTGSYGLGNNCESLAARSYEAADAMLKARL